MCVRRSLSSDPGWLAPKIQSVGPAAKPGRQAWKEEEEEIEGRPPRGLGFAALLGVCGRRLSWLSQKSLL